jgi:large subunit ribosomal protein L4e
VTQKRHAVASALAASTLPPLVMARGHRIGEISELPVVMSDGLESVTKTKAAVAALEGVGCKDELQRVIDSKKVRAGQGKMRNRRYTMRRGPLVIYNEDNGIVRAMRNIPGVETACVDRLNLLKLAPGGNFGRFVIWTEGAFKKLNDIYGTMKSGAPLKKGYKLARPLMENADVARLINSTEVQSVVRAKLDAPKKFTMKMNPLKNKQVMARLNPGSMKRRAARAQESQDGTDKQKEVQSKKKATFAASKDYNKKQKTGDDTFYKKLMKAFETKAAEKEGEAAEGGEDDA